MWYVLKVRTGSEENVRAKYVENVPGEVLEECSVFYYEEMHRYRGEWVTEKRVFLPGYLFVATEEIDELEKQLRRIDGKAELLGNSEEILPLTLEEAEFLQSLGGKEQIIRMSEGIIEKSQLKVMSGPLRGKERLIRKIDRHKRRAYLEVPFFGEMQTVRAGLEVVSKTV